MRQPGLRESDIPGLRCANQDQMIKSKHWRGLQSIFSLKGLPMLVFHTNTRVLLYQFLEAPKLQQFLLPLLHDLIHRFFRQRFQ